MHFLLLAQEEPPKLTLSFASTAFGSSPSFSLRSASWPQPGPCDWSAAEFVKVLGVQHAADFDMLRNHCKTQKALSATRSTSCNCSFCFYSGIGEYQSSSMSIGGRAPAFRVAVSSPWRSQRFPFARMRRTRIRSSRLRMKPPRVSSVPGTLIDSVGQFVPGQRPSTP